MPHRASPKWERIGVELWDRVCCFAEAWHLSGRPPKPRAPENATEWRVEIHALRAWLEGIAKERQGEQDSPFAAALAKMRGEFDDEDLALRLMRQRPDTFADQTHQAPRAYSSLPTADTNDGSNGGTVGYPPSALFLSAKGLAQELRNAGYSRATDAAVEGFLRRHRQTHKDCFEELPTPRENEERILYRTAHVWQFLITHFAPHD
jgi:hypothetical protein